MNREEAEKFKHFHVALKKMTDDGWDVTKMVCRTFGFIEGSDFERKRAEGLVEAVNKLNEHWKIVFPPNMPIAFMSVSVHLMTNIQEELARYKGEK